MKAIASKEKGTDKENRKAMDVVRIVSGDVPPWGLVMMEFCDWDARRHMMSISKGWWHASNKPSFYRFLSHRLAAEHGVYVPPVPPAHTSWRQLFVELYQLRNLWIPTSHSIETDSTSHASKKESSMIRVFARFRPADESAANKLSAAGNDGGKENGPEVKVALPLHQRLAMIKMSRKLSSNRQALKVLTSEGGWFENRWSKLGKAAANNNRVKASSDCESGASDEFLGKSTRGGTTFETSDNENLPTFLSKLYANDDAHSSAVDGDIAVTKTDNTNQEHAPVGSEKDAFAATRLNCGVQNIDSMANRVVMVAPDVGLREFAFDGVLQTRASQKLLYDTSARRLVTDFLNGFNSTVIVYGQTGSGKTYSMFGRDEQAIYGSNYEGKGVIPRACEEIFQALHDRKHPKQPATTTTAAATAAATTTDTTAATTAAATTATTTAVAGVDAEYDVNTMGPIDAEVFVSYVEVFGEHVSDLLRYGERCGHSKVASQRFVLQGAAERRVESMEDVLTLLRQGEQQKRRAATAMNERSTRAHSLFIVTLKQSRPGTDVTLSSRLFMADLGGSEQVKKSQVEAGVSRVGTDQQFSVGFQLADNMREAVYINLGLLALKKCIEALNQRSSYVPYQDSKLTMLLSEGLGGNSKTSVVICANTDATHVAETVATLRFGERCALIETAARNNATMLAGVLASLDGQIASLEAAIADKERWEVRNEERADELAEEGTLEMAMGAVEVKKVYVLVGAEQERRELATLLHRRAQFVGSSTADEESTVEATAADTTALSTTNEHKVVGFGRDFAELYGIGGKFDETAEFGAENTRFSAAVSDESAVPVTVRTHRGAKSWATGGQIEEEDSAVIERRAQKAKRNRLAYSGISA